MSDSLIYPSKNNSGLMLTLADIQSSFGPYAVSSAPYHGKYGQESIASCLKLTTLS